MAPKPLPKVLPVFPLTGVLLLPGMVLPLHIFEPRYRHMVADAAADGGYIGMIQPFVPQHDNRPLPDAEPEHPDLYPVGCAGRLMRHDRTADGRYLIELRGVTRFRILAELPLHQGYRRVEADYAAFKADSGEADLSVETEPLLDALGKFSGEKGVQLNWEELRKLSSVVLVNTLAMSLPYAPAEKQALLEAAGPVERAHTLTELLAFGTMADSVELPAPSSMN